MTSAPAYQSALAAVHHEGYTALADRAGPAIVSLLEPVRERDGVVLELGCGSGLLTAHLVEAGHNVVATDASPAMLDIARDGLGDAADIRLLTLPHDPLPEADAIVSIGQVLSYVPDEVAVKESLQVIAGALRPGGILAMDMFDLRLVDNFPMRRTEGKVTDDWAIISFLDVPRPNRLRNAHSVFVRNGDETWRREDEVHTQVLIDTTKVPELLAEHGVEAEVGDSFADVRMTPPWGLVTLTGHRPRSASSL